MNGKLMLGIAVFVALVGFAMFGEHSPTVDAGGCCGCHGYGNGCYGWNGCHGNNHGCCGCHGNGHHGHGGKDGGPPPPPPNGKAPKKAERHPYSFRTVSFVR